MGWWRRRPFPVGLVDLPDTRPQSWIERLGLRVQQRTALLSELAPLTVGAAAVTTVLLVVVSPTFALSLAVGTAVLSRLRAIARRRAAMERLAEQAPHALDLLKLCLEAGLSTRSAFGRLAVVVPDPLGGWFRTVSMRAGRGVPFAEALVRSAERGHPMELAARIMASGEESGAAVIPAVEHLAAQARASVRRACLERVRRLPVQMLLPLVCCTLPAFLIVAVVPMVATQLRGLL